MDSDSEHETPLENVSPLRVIEPTILKELEHLDLSSRTVFTKGRLAGSGAYGDVWKGRCVVSGRGNVNVAIKRLRFYLSDDIKMLFEKEIYVWAKLKHANILPLLGYAFDKETGYPLLVSEWMNKGSAWTFVLSHPDCDIMRIITGIARGLAYLHEKGVVHSDIKSDNVLVTDSEDAIICDFGCSRMISSSRTLANLTTGLKGTARYLAYELLDSSDEYSRQSKATDVWAFGMTVFELLAHRRPFASLSEGQAISRIIKLELPPFPEDTASLASSETKMRLWNICQCCWKSDPTQREDMTSIVRYLSVTAKETPLDHLKCSEVDVLPCATISSPAVILTNQRTTEPPPKEMKVEESVIEPLSPEEIGITSGKEVEGSGEGTMITSKNVFPYSRKLPVEERLAMSPVNKNSRNVQTSHTIVLRTPSFLFSLPEGAKEEEESSDSFVRALHDFVPQQQNATCLAFRAGEIIRVLNYDPSGWWDGEIDGRRGWFPSNYVCVVANDDAPVPLTKTARTSTATTILQPKYLLPTNTTHPHMVPLLQSLELLQNTVRVRRVRHYQPAVVCIMQCIRTLLQQTDCLTRNAPLLLQFRMIAQQRKHVLADLALLVSQSKKASSSDFQSDEERDPEEELMLRLAGQVFARVRRFLAVLVQCDVDLPGHSFVTAGDTSTSEIVSDDSTKVPKPKDPENVPMHYGFQTDDELYYSAEPYRDAVVGRKYHDGHSPMESNSTARYYKGSSCISKPTIGNAGHHTDHGRHVSSNSPSSLSSFSSLDSSGMPPTPPFPEGPCTAMQVQQTLRSTHDSLLSTIAAFIGYVHAHSRAAHAPSTGHLLALVRQIVDVISRLLTVVNAVVCVEIIPWMKRAALETAKENMYQVACALADAVREIATSTAIPPFEEEEERRRLLKVATDALKAGSDCVSTVKTCLARPLNEPPYIIVLPPMNTFPETDRQSFVAALNMDFSEPIEEMEDEEDRGKGQQSSIEKDLPSPTSQIHADAASASEETASECRHRNKFLEDKLLHGELPSIPQTSDEDSGSPLAWTLSHDYAPQDVAYNSEGQLVGATLEALIEKMTAHDQILDAGFSVVFFWTFRLFTSPTGLAEAVIARFNLAQPNGLSDADAVLWAQRKLLPVRLRVQNLLKLWLEVHWRAGMDDVALPILQSFVRGTMAEVFAGPAQRLEDLIATRSSMSADELSPVNERQRLSEWLRDAGLPLSATLSSSSSSTEPPRPVTTKALLASLRARKFDSITVTDFDALELARQMTLVESQLYCAITAEEMIELGSAAAPPAVNVKAVSTLSTAITGWVSESILGEQDVKKRALLMKFFIKVADRCTSLNNFSTPRSILAALDSSTISRLHQTWAGLAQKSKIQLEALRKLADYARNYHEYRSRLRNTNPPAVPFLSPYLTDLTFCREGNPSHRASPLVPNKQLLNFIKYHKLACIVQDMQRFQVAYNLKDVPEARQYLHFCLDKAKDHGDMDDLH